MLYRYQNLVLQFVVVVCLGVIGGLIYHNYTVIIDGDKTITHKLDDMDISCPKCPDLKNPIKPEDIEQMKCPSQEKVIPSQCPTASEIAEAVFPGRNTGITKAGRYFDIKSNDSYELLPEYSFFKPEDAFPEDSILDKPLRDGNVKVPPNQIDNSIDGSLIDTQGSASVTRDLDARMSRGRGMSDAARLAQVNRAVASKAPTDASNRLAASALIPGSEESNNRRREMNEDIYN